jgi:hydroxypyruvate isomerase
MQPQPIIFSYWHKNKLQGYIADDFGTITQHKPKVFHDCDDDIDVVIETVQSVMCNKYSAMSKQLLVAGLIREEERHKMYESTLRTQNTVRSWKNFEVKMHPFNTKALPEMELKNLQKAIEVYKFKVVENEN